MTGHPTPTDYRNREERTAAYWRKIAGELAGDFMQFGCHEDDCDSRWAAKAPCSCGFAAALVRWAAAIGEAKP